MSVIISSPPLSTIETLDGSEGSEGIVDARMIRVPQRRPPEPRRRQEAIVKQVRAMEANCAFLSGHRGELLDKYAGQWIAVSGGHLIAHGQTRDHVLRRLRARGTGTPGALVHHLTNKTEIAVL